MHRGYGFLVVDRFCHLEHLSPDRAGLVPVAGPVECCGELEGGAVVVGIALQHPTEQTYGRIRVTASIECIKASPHDAIFIFPVSLPRASPQEGDHEKYREHGIEPGVQSQSHAL